MTHQSTRLCGCLAGKLSAPTESGKPSHELKQETIYPDLPCTTLGPLALHKWANGFVARKAEKAEVPTGEQP